MDSDRVCRVSGSPTSEENAVIVSVLRSVTGQIAQAQALDGDDQTAGDEFADPSGSHPDTQSKDRESTRERLEHQRVCPICNQRYDSKYALNNQRRIFTAEESVICFDRDNDAVYQHSE
jgi:hypothetical protein